MFGRVATWVGLGAAFCAACGAAERDGSEGQGGTQSTGGLGAGGTSQGGGGATTGGASGGVIMGTGGVIASGGATAGKATGGVSAAGGMVSGGTSNGGKVSSGSSSGGAASGGTSSGGRASGGASSGGAASGGTSSGGNASGGASGESGAGGETSAGSGGEGGSTIGSCDEYTACGCGCCMPTPTEVQRCYYPEAGDELSEIVAADRKRAASPDCSSAGCSSGLRYACCLRGSPDPAGAATYSAQYVPTALDRIHITKTGNDGRCGRLSFVMPAFASGPYVSVTFPDRPAGARWGLDQSYEMPCSMSALPPAAMGAIGSLQMRASAGACVVDVHITAFFARNGDVQPVRFDADGLTLAGVNPSFCQ